MVKALNFNTDSPLPTVSFDRHAKPTHNSTTRYGQRTLALPLLIGALQAKPALAFLPGPMPFLSRIKPERIHSMSQPNQQRVPFLLKEMKPLNLASSVGEANEDNEANEANEAKEPTDHHFLGERSIKPKPIYLSDWQACAINPHYRDIFENGYGDVALLNQHDIKKLYEEDHDKIDDDNHNWPTVHLVEMGQCEEVEIATEEASAARQVIDLLQLSEMRFTLPFGVVLVSPDLKEDDVQEQLSDVFAIQLADTIMASLFFDAQGKPQTVGVDVTNLVMETIAKKVDEIQKNAAEAKQPEGLHQRVVSWMADFHQVTKSYYDHNQRGITCSGLSWEMLARLIKTAVLDPNTSGLPPVYITSLMENEEANVKFDEATSLYLELAAHKNQSYDVYHQRRNALQTLRATSMETEACFNPEASMHVEYCSKAHLAIGQDIPATDVYRQLDQLFPATYSEKDEEHSLKSLTLTPNGETVLPYKLPIKHLVKREAERLVKTLESNQAIKDQIEMYNLVATPIFGDRHSAEHAQTTFALFSHFEVMVSEVVVQVLKDNTVSPVLSNQPKFKDFIVEWVRLYKESHGSNQNDYPGKLGVLLDRHFEDKQGRV